MGTDGEKPVLGGGGVLLFEDFCRATGLDPATVADLMETQLVGGGLWRDEEHTQPFGILDDHLPSRGALVAMGLDVRDDYAPETLRGFTMDDD